jgi:hypothetical protein
VIALTRFMLTGYVRSLRALHPAIATFLLIAIVFTSPVGGKQGVLSVFADLAALMFPIWAWAARGLLDTEPDTQRHLTAVAGGRLAMPAGLLACCVANACLAVVALALPIGLGVTNQVTVEVMLLGSMLNLLSALAATFVGALSSRAILPSPGASILVLLIGCLLILVLSIGPLRYVSVPIIEWMHAASNGPGAFENAFPLLALRILGWSCVVAACYGRLRRTRP